MFIPDIEKQSVKDIKRYQEKELQKLLPYLKTHSAFYGALFRENNISIEDITTLEDLTKIPPTTKHDLQTRTNDFLCVDKRQIIDYVTTSGTLGEPVTFAITDNDLERLAYNEYISFACAGVTNEDTFQLMVTMDKRFMAGLAYYLGLRKLGAGIIRTGPGLQELQFESIHQHQPTGLVSVPSFLPKLISYAEAQGINYNNTSIKKAVCIGEPIRNNDFTLNTLGKKITDKWNIKLYSTYASTEMGTAFTECDAGKGGHHHPEMIIVEFLDENNQPVGEDEPGEVTITTLGVEAMPLLRFKTGDICYHHTEPCTCGRNTLRLGPVIGRKKQMLKFKGTTLFPPAIYDVLNEIDCIENYIIEVSTNSLGTDQILIKAGCNQDKPLSEKSIKDHFRARLRVAPEISFYDISEIRKQQFPSGNRKPITFIDKRK
ncbi:MAG: phenylacetate--CoA ligase family protein [Bacteroidetes bacterium]|nr:MAG: phenylacetate--CoA ligase family protein [Bacteroidota bacterium]